MKITVCGSIGFYKAMEDVNDQLFKLGHEVKIPELALEVPEQFGGGRKIYLGQYIEENGGIDAFSPNHQIWDLKEGAINDHYTKIDWADAILVVNQEKRGIPGYIGGNTLIEIGVAFYLKKPIYILNSISSELSYKQEIYGMKPVFLNGNLSLILLKDGIIYKQCDHKSVGMLVWQSNYLLLIERKKPPFGFAPPAGHVDKKGSFAQAAREELLEEVGLNATRLSLICQGLKENHCRRKDGTWHYWQIYEVQTTGQVKACPKETKQAGFHARESLQLLAKKTEKYLRKDTSEEEWKDSPGLEPVWYEWLKLLSII